MFGFRLDFDSPGYLALLGLLPALWWIGFRSLATLGRSRRWLALAFRSAVIVAIVLALAGVQAVWVTERTTVLYLLDLSESIPRQSQSAMLDYAIENVQRHRDRAREDRVGLIVFGRDASIEVPPFAADLLPMRYRDGTPRHTEATNLESALRLAQAVMPADSRRRVVLISDGNETEGDATAALARLVDSGIGIDVLPVRLDRVNDVQVDKIDLPSDVRKGQPFDARVVLFNHSLTERPEPTRGRLTVTRRLGGEDQLLINQSVELDSGRNVFPLRLEIDDEGAYTYTAKFIPDSPADDLIAENNSATAFTYVRGRSRVLLIEPWESTGEYRPLADSLREADIAVTIQASNSLFGSLAELQAYDAVILAGVARNSGDSADSISSFSDPQIEMLVRNTQQLGCGLLMIGGPEALGAGGWSGTKLEEAMPVDFEIKNAKVAAVGALQLVLDTSGSMEGEKLTLCKAAAIEAVKTLQPDDSIGVLTFDSEPHEIVPLQRIGQRTHIIPRIANIAAGGGTDLFPAMEQGFRSLRNADASTKHMIILTDGQTPPNRFRELTTRMRDEGITVSGVAVGDGADVELVRSIVSIGGGKLYHVRSPQAIPKILMREARRVSRGLIHEDSRGFLPTVRSPHAVIGGIDSAPPPITGLVLTTPKTNPLVHTVLTSPMPPGRENPLLSLWQFGLGRSAVLTTDAGQRWATDWRDWPGYGKFFEQLIRWLMRPSGDAERFSIATQTRDREVEVIVHALDQADDFLNFLPMNASALDPDLKPIPLTMRQTAPGRYVGRFPVEASGNYFINVAPEPGVQPLTTAISLPYGDEYRLRPWNEPLLTRLAAATPRGGSAGELLAPLDTDVSSAATRSDPFRPGVISDRSIRDIWPWAVLVGCCLFLGDVFVRRVAVSLAWLRRAPATQQVTESPQLAKLTKLATQQRERRLTTAGRAKTAEPISVREPSVATDVTDEPAKAEGAASYTERLLAAKRAAASRR